MKKDKDLGINIVGAFIFGNIDAGQATAMIEVLSGGPLFKELPSEEQAAMGAARFYHVLDTDGELLIAGKNYMLYGKKVKVLREQFGSGNFLDKYFRVFYIDASLEEHLDTVDATYIRGVFAAPIYRSNFKPIIPKEGQVHDE